MMQGWLAKGSRRARGYDASPSVERRDQGCLGQA